MMSRCLSQSSEKRSYIKQAEKGLQPYVPDVNSSAVPEAHYRWYNARQLKYLVEISDMKLHCSTLSLSLYLTSATLIASGIVSMAIVIETQSPTVFVSKRTDD